MPSSKPFWPPTLAPEEVAVPLEQSHESKAREIPPHDHKGKPPFLVERVIGVLLSLGALWKKSYCIISDCRNSKSMRCPRIPRIIFVASRISPSYINTQRVLSAESIWLSYWVRPRDDLAVSHWPSFIASPTFEQFSYIASSVARGIRRYPPQSICHEAKNTWNVEEIRLTIQADYLRYPFHYDRGTN